MLLPQRVQVHCTFWVLFYNLYDSYVILILVLIGGPLKGISIASDPLARQTSALFNPSAHEDESSDDEEIDVGLDTNAKILA